MAVIKSELDKFLKAQKFRNVAEVYRQWVRDGHTEKTRSGKITHNVVVGGQRNVKCIKILPRDDESDSN